MPLYVLGLMGATRRLDHYEAASGWQPLFIVAAIGVALITLGVGFQMLQAIVSIKQRKQNLDTTGDPWNGRTLEWATASPPPVYNFAMIPKADARDPFWVGKQEKEVRPNPSMKTSIFLKIARLASSSAGLAFSSDLASYGISFGSHRSASQASLRA